jgi:hypothetical protein
MKRVKKLLIVLALNIVWGSCWVSSANAGVITAGTWSDLKPSAYWNNPSWDGPGMNFGELLSTWGMPLEYLGGVDGAPVGFAFDQADTFWEIGWFTSWTDGRGIWQLGDGSITFKTHGYTYNTLTTPQQFSLFRSVGSTAIVYFLGIEDVPGWMTSDHDFNDYMAFTIEYPAPPTPTPEPGTLALMLCGGVAAFTKMRSRKA